MKLFSVPEENQQMLVSVSSDDKLLRALCGDAEAEKEIIRIFRDTTNFEEKQKWVRPLAFIGTDACAKALIEGLNSTVFGLVVHGDYEYVECCFCGTREEVGED